MRGGTFSAIAFAVSLSLCVRAVHACIALLRTVNALHTMEQNHHVDFFLWATKRMLLQCATFIRLIYIDRPILTYHWFSDVCFFFNEYDSSILS